MNQTQYTAASLPDLITRAKHTSMSASVVFLKLVHVLHLSSDSVETRAAVIVCVTAILDFISFCPTSMVKLLYQLLSGKGYK